jgi:hypothetical protein
MSTIREELHFDGERLGGLESRSFPFSRDAFTRIKQQDTATAKAIIRALHNMARAVEQQLLGEEEDRFLGELEVTLNLEHGGPWINGKPEEYGVFDCWLRFSAGPSGVYTDILDQPFEANGKDVTWVLKSAVVEDGEVGP